MEWIKLYADKVLRGTMAREPLEYQAIWFRLMCLANSVSYRDGTLRFPPNIPMSRAYIATDANIPLDLLNEAIEYYKNEINEDPNSPHYGKARMQELDGGILFLTNFKESQAVPDGKAKKEYKEQSKARARDRQNSLDSLRREVNRLNMNITEVGKKLRYVERDGEILDTETGEVVPFSKGGKDQ